MKGLIFVDERKILVVFGTRPEAIKMCPLIIELRKRNKFNIITAVTGQHREMLDQALDAFRVCPEYDLKIMKEGQSLIELLIAVMDGIVSILDRENPDLTLVHGDTVTAYATAVACYLKGFATGHVEAGLRTYNITEPFPEEFNRRSIGLIANYHFAPTELAKKNLIREGTEETHVYVTGNTGIDALKYTVRENYTNPYLTEAGKRKLILVTLHRRENWDGPMRNVLRALRRILDENRERIFALYPMHKNPRIRKIAEEELGGCDNIIRTEPFDVAGFHNIMAKCYFVLTDSGGIQEEAPYFGKPVLVARNVTERPEGVEAGTLKLIGTQEDGIYYSMKELLENPEAYQEMSKAINPYGDGTSSIQIADIIEKILR